MRVKIIRYEGGGTGESTDDVCSEKRVSETWRDGLGPGQTLRKRGVIGSTKDPAISHLLS